MAINLRGSWQQGSDSLDYRPTSCFSFIVSDTTKRTVRVTLTKSQLSTDRGAELFRILSEITQDGMLSNGEIDKLKAWLATSGIEQLPAEQHLSNILSVIIANGSISADERRNFQKEIERVLPPSQRAEAKAARELRETEFDEIAVSTVSPKSVNSDIAKKLDQISAKQQSNQDALSHAAAAHRVQPGQIAYEMSIPGRQPYEPNATMKQKDYLWGLGVRDQAILENLGKWQASAVIDQIKQEQGKKQNSSMAAALLVVIILVILGLFAVARSS